MSQKLKASKMFSRRLILSFTIALGSVYLPTAAVMADTAQDEAAFEIAAHDLPTIPKYQTETPPASEILSWDKGPKSRFIPQAQQRQQQAQERADKAIAMLQRIQLRLKSLVPGQTGYGESIPQFNDRIAAAKNRVNQLEKPYKDEVTNAQKALSDANSVLDACLVADRGLRDDGFVIRP